MGENNTAQSAGPHAATCNRDSLAESSDNIIGQPPPHIFGSIGYHSLGYGEVESVRVHGISRGGYLTGCGYPTLTGAQNAMSGIRSQPIDANTPRLHVESGIFCVWQHV